MGELLMFILYAMAFIAVVLAVEGVWFAIRNYLGEERRFGRRLTASQQPGAQPVNGKETAVDRWLKAQYPALDIALYRARCPLTAAQLVAAAVATFLLLLMGITGLGAPPLLAFAVAAAVAVGAPVGLLSLLITTRRRRFLYQMPQAVDLIARSLQVGHPVTTAMTVVSQQMSAPIGPEFGVVIQEMSYGLDREEALDNLVKRFPLPELRMFVASMEVTRESGGNLSEVFLRLSEGIRARLHLKKKVEAISAEGKMSFWVVSSLPVLVGCGLVVVRPTFFTGVIHDPLFWPMMSIAPIMLTLGAAIIWRLVNIRI